MQPPWTNIHIAPTSFLDLSFPPTDFKGSTWQSEIYFAWKLGQDFTFRFYQVKEENFEPGVADLHWVWVLQGEIAWVCEFWELAVVNGWGENTCIVRGDFEYFCVLSWVYFGFWSLIGCCEFIAIADFDFYSWCVKRFIIVKEWIWVFKRPKWIHRSPKSKPSFSRIKTSN